MGLFGFFKGKKALLVYKSVDKRELVLSEKVITIQRNEDFIVSDEEVGEWIRKVGPLIEIADFILSKGISREKHASLIWNRDLKKYSIVKNTERSTQVNNVELMQGTPRILNDKDKITLGKRIKMQIIY